MDEGARVSTYCRKPNVEGPEAGGSSDGNDQGGNGDRSLCVDEDDHPSVYRHLGHADCQPAASGVDGGAKLSEVHQDQEPGEDQPVQRAKRVQT